MTMFIRQEAIEKAKEIQIKADEEFAIEKSKLVRQETSSIDTQYEKKFKQASMSQQITRSTLANKTRLKVLGARQQLLDELFEKAEKKLEEVAKGDRKRYQGICEGLVLEGLYKLNEDRALVRARKADYELVKKAIEGARGTYKEKVGREARVEIDEGNPLPEDSYVYELPAALDSGTDNVSERVVSRSSAAGARSTSIIPLRSVCTCWRRMRCRWCARSCSGRTRIGGSTIERAVEDGADCMSTGVLARGLVVIKRKVCCCIVLLALLCLKRLCERNRVTKNG